MGKTLDKFLDLFILKKDRKTKPVKIKIVETPVENNNTDNKKKAKEFNRFGITEHGKGHLKKALYFFNKAIKEDPTNYAYWKNRGAVLDQQGDVKKAILALEKAEELNPERIRTKYELGKLYFKDDSFEKAAKYFGKVESVPEYSDNFILLSQMGISLLRLEKAREAITFLDRALKKKENVDVLIFKTIALMDIEDYQEAMKTSNRTIELLSKDPFAWEIRANLCEELGLPEEATCRAKAEKFSK